MESSTDTPLERQTYNVREVAAIIGVSERHIYSLAIEGRLPGMVKFGGRWILPRSKLSAILENGTDPAPAAVEA